MKPELLGKIVLVASIGHCAIENEIVPSSTHNTHDFIAVCKPQRENRSWDIKLSTGVRREISHVHVDQQKVGGPIFAQPFDDLRIVLNVLKG